MGTDLFCMGCSLRHIFFAVCWKCADEGACFVRFHAGRRGHMKLHTTLSAELNATALLFIMRAQTSCASSCWRTGEYLVFFRATVLVQRVFCCCTQAAGKHDCVLDASSSACTAVTEA